MGIMDSIIQKSPFLHSTQNAFGNAPPAQAPQPMAPQVPAPQAPPQAQGQGGGQQGPGGIDLGMIMKIMSMFGGA